MSAIRRLTALVLGMALLHLSAARADAACAAHDVSGTQQSMPMPGHDMQHSADGAPPGCDTPAQAQCCQVLASCSVVFTASAPSAMLSLGVLEEVALIARPEHPISLSTAPEPPPPRA